MLVPDFPNYTVSPFGFVLSTRQGKEVRVGSFNSGYEIVTLVNDLGHKWDISTHILVAQCFIPNPEGLPVVNHLDGDKANNAVYNLEWSTQRDNCKHSVTIDRPPRPKFKSPFGSFRGRPVVQLLDGKELAKYRNSYEAGRQCGIDGTSINDVCKGYSYRKSAGGFKWEYTSLDEYIPTTLVIEMYSKIFHTLHSEAVDTEHLIKYIKEIAC